MGRLVRGCKAGVAVRVEEGVVGGRVRREHVRDGARERAVAGRRVQPRRVVDVSGVEAVCRVIEVLGVGEDPDAQNLYHSAHSFYSRNVDYAALLESAVGDRSLVRAIAYVIRADSPDEESFFEALRDIGFETKIKPIKTFADGSKKADWDVGMSLDAVTLANHLDTVVLCTGDGDFARLCSHLRHEGVRVEAMAFERAASEELIDAVDEFVDLSEREDRYLL